MEVTVAWIVDGCRIGVAVRLSKFPGDFRGHDRFAYTSIKGRREYLLRRLSKYPMLVCDHHKGFHDESLMTRPTSYCFVTDSTWWQYPITSIELWRYLGRLIRAQTSLSASLQMSAIIHPSSHILHESKARVILGKSPLLPTYITVRVHKREQIGQSVRFHGSCNSRWEMPVIVSIVSIPYQTLTQHSLRPCGVFAVYVDL